MPCLLAPLSLSSHLFAVYAEFPHLDSGNVYLLTGAVPTLIDCGSRRAWPRLRANLAAAGVRVEEIAQVIATHGDCDHTQGIHELHHVQPGIPLLLHSADWPLVREADPYRNAGYLYRTAFTPVEPDSLVPLRDGDRIPAGNGTLEVLHTPGHTEGSVCLLGEIDGRQVLLAGDTVGGAMRSLRGADLEIWAQAARSWERSLERIGAREIDWVLNGHEPVASLPLTRDRLDRGIASFGKMLNPWFVLGEITDDDDMGAAPAPAQSAAW